MGETAGGGTVVAARLISGRHRSAVRRVPMTVVGSAEQSEIPGIGTTAQRIGEDVVYLDHMS